MVFPFIYHFNSRIGVLVHSSFADDSSEGFQQHFSIISKFVCYGFYIKKNVAFTLISFTEMRWMLISSTGIWVTGSDTGLVASRLEANLLDQNVNELEYELCI